MDPINLAAIVKPDLMLLAEELGVKVVKAMRKPEIIKAIEDCGAGADEISECWSEVQKRRREAELRAAQRAAQEELHAAQEGLRVAREKLELEMLQRNFDAGEAIVVDNSSKKFDMRALLQPFRVGGDMGLYLVNFERVCVKMGLVESSWPQRLLSLLPAEVADVLARLDPTAADDYASVKSYLLRKFRLSPEAFRQKFRETRKGPDESYAEFAYKLKGFLESWLRGVNSYEDREKVLEQIALEQFLSCIPTGLKEWIQDRPEVETAQKAADYADEYCSRHGKKVVEENRSSNRFYERCGPHTFVKKGAEKGKESEVPTKGVSDSDEKKRKMKAFEERKPIVCYRCKQPGHVASGCRVPKVAPVNLCLGEAEDLLRPYLYDMKVNGKFCKGLRDTGATYDLVHSSLVEQEHFTGDCVWIRQALENRAVSLPVAKVKLNGPFGIVETEAAVSDGVLPNCPYTLSNRTARQLSESGIPLDMNPVLVVTRSMTTSAVPETLQTEASATTGKTSSGPDEEPNEGADMTTLVSPESSNFRALAGVDKLKLIAEKSSDPSLSKCRDSVGKEIKPNISFFMSNGILYRSFKDKSGNEVDQIVVPSKYRIALLELAHGEGWSGHLGITKTKCRLLAEYYWPGCFKEAEQFVRSCDTCQRTGRPNERRKAPLTLVPIITEPFKRLVIDVVGPLPTTKTGFRYLLTILCPASKFPEAVPMKEQTSVEVVDNLLSVFSRVGFPSEIQCDLGSVFTSALKPAFSRAELVYGRNLRSPLRLLREGWEGEAENPTVVEYVLSLLNRLHKTRELVEANLGKAQSRGKTYYDKNSRLRTFKLLKESVDQMLELGLIERCESDFVSPMILVETPGKEPHPCVDYRKLNAVTVTKVYPIPNIETCLEKVSKAKFISTIDLVRGYWQVPLTANASNLAAFMTPFGVFKPLVLSFGLKNAPYAFSRLMNLVLVGTESFALPYLDDVAIFSDTWREHVQHLEQVFSRLQDAGLTVKAKKCKFGRGEVSYLGHVVGQGMRRPQELKVQAIKEFPLPQTKKDLMSFIGVVNYYHQYIPQFSEKASPLTDALKKTEPTKIKWDDRKIDAFEALKLALATQPVLVSPDYTRPFLVQCDASEKGLGVVLSQEN
ncbi:uncharacterized protein ISCGN_006045 [Ixodes scapularis]